MSSHSPAADFGPLFHGCALNITAMSLNGKLNVSVNCCPTYGDCTTTSMLRSRSCANSRSRRATERRKAHAHNPFVLPRSLNAVGLRPHKHRNEEG